MSDLSDVPIIGSTENQKGENLRGATSQEEMATLDSWKAANSPGTWSMPNMLTSEKYAELLLDMENATFKGRCVHIGDKEFHSKRKNVIEERRRQLAERGMVVRPVSGTELRCVLSTECAIALREDYEPELRIGDENQA